MADLQPGTTMYRIAELERIVSELRAEWIQAVHRIANLEDHCAALENRQATEGKRCPCGEPGDVTTCPGSWHGCQWHDEGEDPETTDYDPGPEVDGQGGMTELRGAVLLYGEER